MSGDNEKNRKQHGDYFKRNWTECYVHENYNEKGLLHHDEDKPAKIVYDQKAQPVVHEYYKHGVVHREGDKPAIVERLNSRETREIYCQAGQVHRTKGPAHTVWQSSLDAGPPVALYELWAINGLVHRIDGPAVVIRDSKGQVQNEFFFLDGFKLKEQDYKKCVEIRQSKEAINSANQQIKDSIKIANNLKSVVSEELQNSKENLSFYNKLLSKVSNKNKM